MMKFAELSREARQHALSEAAEGVEFSFYADAMIDDAKTVAGILGFDVDNLWYSGFSSQGDGACMTGTYRYAKGAVRAIKDYAPLDTELHRIAKELQDTQRRNFYKLEASVSHYGRHYHSGCMSVDVEHSEDRYRDIGSAGTEIADSLRQLADWAYRQLEKEYEYQTGEEALTESLSELEFDEEGNIA